MKLLVDANLSPRIVDGLHHAGNEAIHFALLVADLPTIAEDLERGAIASLEVRPPGGPRPTTRLSQANTTPASAAQPSCARRNRQVCADIN
jgi:hypothetical protein